MNIIANKYQNEIYFYIPELCLILKEKNFTENLENFLLEQCDNKMKFSLYVYWIISSYKQEKDDNKKLKNFLSILEMSLVNGINLEKNLIIKNEILNDKEIYKENISKEFRANYYNICIKFYQALKNFCEKLKNFPLKERKNLLNIFLNNQNKKISLLIKNETIKDASKLIQGLYRGYLLPFNDSENVLDEESYLIVKFNNIYSQCLSTKARVPCKLIFEVIKVKDLINYDNYILDNIIYLGRQTAFINKDNNNIKEEKINIIKEEKEKYESLNIFLYNEIKKEENIIQEEENNNSNNNIIITNIFNFKSIKEKIFKKNKNLDLIKLSNENRSLSTGELLYSFNSYGLINLECKYDNPFGEKFLEISKKIKK